MPGLDLVLAGVALAADRIGWEVVGIRDGYDGLLYREHYREGGLVPLSPAIADTAGCGGSLIGTWARTDPFCVRWEPTARAGAGGARTPPRGAGPRMARNLKLPMP